MNILLIVIRRSPEQEGKINMLVVVTRTWMQASAPGPLARAIMIGGPGAASPGGGSC